MEVSGPALDSRVALRLLGFEVGKLAVERSVSHADLAKRLSVPRASVSLALAGRTLLSRAALEVILDHLDANESVPRLLHLLALAKSADRRPEGRDGDLVVGLEAYAERIEIYDAAVPSGLMNDSGRRAVLATANPPAVVWVLEEHVRRRVLASDDAEWFWKVAALPTVSVLVVPEHAHPGLAHGFEITHGPAGTVVCEETRLRHLYHHRPDATAEYADLFARLRALASPCVDNSSTGDRPREVVK